MRITIRDITRDNLGDLPEPCKACTYWENPEAFERSGGRTIKREWFLKTLKGFGSCGKIGYFDERAVGYAQYGPSYSFPNIESYDSGPVNRVEQGVVFLACLFIADEGLREKGLGSRLLKVVIEDLKGRGFNAIETFARRGDANNPSGPMEFYLKSGFHVQRETNPEFPLMRLDL